MTELARTIGESLAGIIYGVATVLLYPVLAAEVLALIAAVFEFGRYTVEAFKRFRMHRRVNIEAVAGEVGRANDVASVAAALGGLGGGPIIAEVIRSLQTANYLSRSRVLKSLADGEFVASKRLERTRILVRIGPILGLMGTLIPISPALVALAQGDVQTLSNNLVIAFSTTVVGLLIGGLAYVITTMRDRFYRQDIVDIEYVFDRREG